MGIFDDIEYIGKGEWVTDTALAHYRGYDVDNTRRLMNTLAAMKLLDRGKSVRGYGHGELTVNCEHSYAISSGPFPRNVNEARSATEIKSEAF